MSPVVRTWMIGVVAASAVVGELPKTALAGEARIFAYLDGRGSLAAEAARHAEQFMALSAGGRIGGIAVLEAVSAPAGAGGRRWRPGTQFRPSRSPWRGDVSATLRGDVEAFLGWTNRLGRTRHDVLVLMGHGLATASGDEPRLGVPQILENDGQHGITGREFREVLCRHGGAGVLVLESCFGASLELLTELEECADFVIACPGELPSPGLPWGKMLQTLGSERGDSTPGLATALLRGVAEDEAAKSSGVFAWSVGVIEMARLERVRRPLAAVSAACLGDIEAAAAAVVRARQNATHGESLRQLCDVGEWCQALDAYATTAELRRAAGELAKTALDARVARVCFGDTPKRCTERIGLTLFLPPPLTRSVSGYVAGSDLARRTGYGRFLECYLRYYANLVPDLG